MPDDNLLATLEQSLRQARQQRARLAGRLAELEAETEKVRTDLAEMDTLASQTETAMFRILSSVIGSTSAATVISSPSVPSDAMIEAVLRQDAARSNSANMSAPTVGGHVVSGMTPRPSAHPDTETKTNRFLDRTIPQATAMILREEGEPLHVNELYNRLLEGGFVFSGQHPTISIAVSLNRNRRFRKVAPGTFDLAIREAVQVS